MSLTLDQYLSNPTYEHCEWIDGEAVEATGGDLPHARALGKVSRFLGECVRSGTGAYAAVRLGCLLSVRGRPRVYLPDAAVVLSERNPDEIRYLEGAPELVVEIRSLDDSLSTLVRKIQDYFTNGTKLAWVILPDERAVLIFVPNAPTRTAVTGETLDGGELLPDLKIPVDALFA